MQPDQKIPEPLRDTTLGILVSLYLILLGFFAVLNSLSQDRIDKAGAVLDSVNQSFSAAASGPEVINLLNSGGQNGGDAALIDGLRELFSNAVTFDGNFPAGGGALLTILLPKSDLFEDGVQLSERAREQFEALGSIIAAFGEQRIEFAVALGVGERFPLAAPSGVQPLSLQRAGALSRFLGDIAGFEAKARVGFAASRPQHVQLQIHIRDGKRPVLNFAAKRRR